MAYNKELREAMVAKMLPPNNQSITKISKQEGIPEVTLRKWRDSARANGQAAPATDGGSDDWSTEDKFLIVVETSGMTDEYGGQIRPLERSFKPPVAEQRATFCGTKSHLI